MALASAKERKRETINKRKTRKTRKGKTAGLTMPIFSIRIINRKSKGDKKECKEIRKKKDFRIL